MFGPMERLLRLPVILALFALGMALSAASFVPKFIYLGGESMTIDVPALGEYSAQVNYTGLVKAQASVPEGVEVYVMTDAEYERYLNEGALPKEYISSDSDTVWVRNPSTILALNSLDRNVELVLSVELYERRMPLALLSIPAYMITVLAASLLMLRVVKKFGEEMRSALPEGHR